VGALGAFAAYQADVVHVAMDESGFIPEALATAISQMSAQGRRIKFLYTVPSFHNPAGVTMSAARCLEVLGICEQVGVLVVEDNPSGLHRFEGDQIRPLRAHARDGVVYLGSFSKTIAAGLRVGWAVAPPGIRDKLVLATESAVLCPVSFAQLTIRCQERRCRSGSSTLETGRGRCHRSRSWHQTEPMTTSPATRPARPSSTHRPDFLSKPRPRQPAWPLTRTPRSACATSPVPI